MELFDSRNIFSKQLISFRYNGKLCSLAHLKEIFHIGGEGRNLTPRPLYGTFLITFKIRSWNLVFCAGKHQRIISIMYEAFFILFRVMHFNALLKRVTPQNVKSIFRYNISSKQLISFRYNGKLCSLAHLKEIFHIGGEGRNLTPRPLYGTFLIVHSKYVVGT